MINIQKYHSLFHKLEKPFAFIDLNAFDDNFNLLHKKSANKAIRVATKSIRSVDLLKRLADKGINRWMCFTINEAVELSKLGFDNLMVAYPSLQPAAVKHVCAEIKKGKTIYLTVDTIHHLSTLDQIAKKENVLLPISIDIDVSVKFTKLHFGVYRSSIKTVEQFKSLFYSLDQYNHLVLKGVMTYDAQIAGVADKQPKKGMYNETVKLLKRQSLPKIKTKREQITQFLKEQSIQLDYFNAGGTGSLELVAADENVTEVTFGSGLFAPTLFDAYQDFSYEPAAGFVLEICRQPEKNIYTCLGGGYIASGSVGKEKSPTIIYPKNAKLTSNEGAGEVQSPFTCAEQLDLTTTNFAVLRHAKAGEYCERFNHLVLLKDGQHIDTITTYRGDGYCFL